MKKDVLVFFSFQSHKSGYIEMLFSQMAKQAAQAHDLQLHRGALKELVVQVIDGRLSVIESLTGRDIASFDAVYFELWYKAQQQALAAGTYLDRHNVPFFAREVVRVLPDTKLGEFAALSDNGLPLPKTFVSSKRQTLAHFKTNPPIPYPIIVKSSTGFGGRKNYLVHNYKELQAVYKEHPQDVFIIQEFIPNEYDYRCLMLGGEIAVIIKRQRQGDTHLNNASKGAQTEVIDPATLTAEQAEDVKKAARLVHREDLSGVDLLFNSETGQHYILEVNQAPQIETGAHVPVKTAALLAYIRQHVEGATT